MTLKKRAETGSWRHLDVDRLTRFTNVFSKNAEDHEHAIAIHFMHDNVVRIHTALRVTATMAVKMAGRLWNVADMVKARENWEAWEAENP